MGNTYLSEVSELRNYSVEYEDLDRLILAKRNLLYEVKKDNLKLKKKIGEFKLPLWKSILIRFQIIQRLLRCFFYNVIVLKNGDIFFTFNKSIGLIKKNGDFQQLNCFHRSFRVLRNSIAETKDGSLFFGEYLSNSDRDIMRIYMYKPGDISAKVVHIFPKGSIRHIHGIYYDEFSDSLWCVTGDVSDECQIIQSFDKFETLSVIGSGDETWRAVSLLFTKDYIYYAMDAEFEQNKIFKISRQNMQRINLGYIDGPVYYSIKREDDCFFQVTAELCPSQDDKHASIWHVKGSSVKKIWTKKKDYLPQIFMPGTVHFPNGSGDKKNFYFNCVGISGTQSRTYKCIIK